MNLKYPRILYFIAGSAPTKDEATEAAKLGPNTVFRNVLHVKDEMLEACDGVAGAVHARYADKPNGFQVVEKFVRGLGIGGDSKNVEAIQSELQTARADLAQAHDAIQKLNNTVGELQGKLAKRANRQAAQTPDETPPDEQPATGASEATGSGWGPNA